LKYAVVYERGPRSWGAYVPDLPGCVAVAKTRAEVKRLIREAIEMHIEGLREAGQPIPKAESSTDLVEV
jgi:predicted RNase H-like HicB family nuclease